MCFFHKKSKGEKTKEDNELISQNARSIEALLVLASGEGAEEFKAELKKLQEDLKYLVPSESDKVKDFDKKIKNAIEDLRIELVKGDGEIKEKAQRLLKQIKLDVADRNVKL